MIFVMFALAWLFGVPAICTIFQYAKTYPIMSTPEQLIVLLCSTFYATVSFAAIYVGWLM